MWKIFFLLFLSTTIGLTGVRAHYGMIIPSDSMISQGEKKTIQLQFAFAHPFETKGMDLQRPKQVFIKYQSLIDFLLPTLQPLDRMGGQSWSTHYRIKRPGVYTIVMEPHPYWEPAEDIFIIHYTKTVIAAFGDEEGWDHEVGLATEIVPLTRPFGIYVGNVFQGMVKKEGKPVAFAEVELEYYNQDGQIQAPNNFMITQTLKTDNQGIFTISVPTSGWWGIAALSKADYQLPHKGTMKDVELGAVLWLEFLERPNRL